MDTRDNAIEERMRARARARRRTREDDQQDTLNTWTNALWALFLVSGAVILPLGACTFIQTLTGSPRAHETQMGLIIMTTIFGTILLTIAATCIVNSLMLRRLRNRSAPGQPTPTDRSRETPGHPVTQPPTA